MKKSIFIFLFIILLGTMDISKDIKASTTNIGNLEEEILEEVLNYDNKSINIKITIPASFTKDKVLISPKIFYMIKHYRLLNNNKKILVNIIIDNKSNNTYSYIKDSLLIEPLINNQNTLYRTQNEAIKNLYKNSKIKLDNNNISIKLKELGYLDITELDKYYLDFYNKKYNLDIKDLNYYSKDIFINKISKVIETNQNIIDLSNNYYFQEILKIKINNTLYSLNETKEYYINDSEFIYNLDIVNNTNVNKVEFTILLDKNYNNLFKNYLSGKIQFELKKI